MNEADRASAAQSRRRSREFALQGMYQWQLAGTDAATIAPAARRGEGFDKIDRRILRTLLEERSPTLPSWSRRSRRTSIALSPA